MFIKTRILLQEKERDNVVLEIEKDKLKAERDQVNRTGQYTGHWNIKNKPIYIQRINQHTYKE